MRKGLDMPLARARGFYAILAAAMAIGYAISVSGIDPMAALFWAAVINAVISVPVMVAVMIAASSQKVMGTMTLGRRWKVLGWIATGAMAAASVALAIVSFR
jgi:Mn2+/Fe2+ NRAMP family transporter